jgi:hypothetical protein
MRARPVENARERAFFVFCFVGMTSLRVHFLYEGTPFFYPWLLLRPPPPPGTRVEPDAGVKEQSMGAR